jgi:hypothetical protein
MATVADIIARVRNELGDFGTTFRDVFVGTGELVSYDLSLTNIATAVLTTVNGATVTTLDPSLYTLDAREGRIFLQGAAAPLADGTTLIVNGTRVGMFSDADLTQYINDAVLQHCYGRTVRSRYKDSNGFLQISQAPVTLANLPPVEDLLVALLATSMALWTLITDAASDVDLSTPEGTHVDREQRFRQMLTQVQQVTGRYQELCAQLDVGMYRMEQATLRRVSKTTGRLVPIFEEREYDDPALPLRELPEIDHHDDDDSGLPSPSWGGWW